jgi:hypothetical protein
VRPISHWSSTGSLPSSRFRKLVGGRFNHTVELARKLSMVAGNRKLGAFPRTQTTTVIQ